MRARKPEDRWSWEVPLTDEELNREREESVKREGRPEIVFTCDGCSANKVCTLAFDPYNTDGDCLYEK